MTIQCNTMSIVISLHITSIYYSSVWYSILQCSAVPNCNTVQIIEYSKLLKYSTIGFAEVNDHVVIGELFAFAQSWLILRFHNSVEACSRAKFGHLSVLYTGSGIQPDASGMQRKSTSGLVLKCSKI